MKVLFSRLAVMELEDASGYYALEQQGLGGSFRAEVQQAIRRIIRLFYRIRPSFHHRHCPPTPQTRLLGGPVTTKDETPVQLVAFLP